MRHGVNILVNLLWLAAATGVFWLIALILAEDLPMPDWMPFDVHDGPWVAAILKLFGVVIIMPPFAAVLVSIMRIGAYRARGSLFADADAHVFTLKLPAGTRVAGIGLGFGLCLAVVGVLVWQDDPIAIWVFASPLMVLGLYGGLVFAMLRVDFNQDRITAMTPFFRWQTHQWANLEAVTSHNEWQEFRLHFADGRKARVSYYFNNLHDFVGFVRAKLEENARARTA